MNDVAGALIPRMIAIEPRPMVVERSDVRADLERMHGESWGWALACCGHDRELAQDVLQTAYLRILSGAARFGGQSRFRTWVFGVIRMTARAERRRRWLWLQRHGRDDEALAIPDESRDAAEVSDCAAALASAMSNLSTRQREVVHLVFYQGLTIEEAASVMDVSVGSARTHYDRGKKALAGLLAGWRSE